MNLAFILGRTPELALKEIEKTATILPFQWSATIVQPDVLILKSAETPQKSKSKESGSDNVETLKHLARLQRRLGGVLRIVNLTEQFEFQQTNHYLENLVKQLVGESKFTLGLSIYGPAQDATRILLNCKKKLRTEGVSLRVVPPKQGQQLSTAQVFHNNLALFNKKDEPQYQGAELVLIKEGQGWWLGQTLTVQDIDSYAKRDFEIPVPDPLSGMLSPKLAQSLINLTVGEADPAEVIVYDPFCGSGRIVEEARLMGYQTFGSDLVEEKVRASRLNLQWMGEQYNLHLERPLDAIIWQQDALDAEVGCSLVNLLTKQNEVESRLKLYITGEPYLGKPLRAPLQPNQKDEWLQEVAPLYESFFTNWADPHWLRCGCPRPERFVLVFPRPKVQGEKEGLSLYKHLIDRLNQLGYSSSILSSYERPDTLVSRDLIQVEYRK